MNAQKKAAGLHRRPTDRITIGYWLTDFALLPPAPEGVTGCSFGSGWLTNLGLLVDDEPDEHPNVPTASAVTKQTSIEKRMDVPQNVRIAWAATAQAQANRKSKRLD
jgi:hypothetical protein